ncbi:hypothetical protein [Corallococcus terminator]|nr:hypothetical protein [Corallococcus terminator]
MKTLWLVLMGVLLSSCGAGRQKIALGAEELRSLVLFIQEQPDGTRVHSWRSVDEVESVRYLLKPGAGGGRRIVLTAAGSRDCDAENRECVRACMARPVARGYGHVTTSDRGKGGKQSHCEGLCNQPYMDCSEIQERKPRQFSAVDAAVDWLERNQRGILVGSVVVIAGVAFVVVSAGAGLIILAPAALLASGDSNVAPVVMGAMP